MSEGASPTSRIVYWLLGLIGTFLILLVGAVINQQINQVSSIISRLESLDRRIGIIEIRSSADNTEQREIARRLSAIETDTRDIRERIRKLY